MPDTGLRVLAAVFALLFLATMWPIHPLVSRAMPFDLIMGLPFSLVYVLGITVLGFVVLVAYELRTPGGDDS